MANTNVLPAGNSPSDGFVPPLMRPGSYEAKDEGVCKGLFELLPVDIVTRISDSAEKVDDVIEVCDGLGVEHGRLWVTDVNDLENFKSRSSGSETLGENFRDTVTVSVNDLLLNSARLPRGDTLYIYREEDLDSATTAKEIGRAIKHVVVFN